MVYAYCAEKIKLDSYLASPCLAFLRETGASKTPFPSGSSHRYTHVLEARHSGGDCRNDDVSCLAGLVYNVESGRLGTSKLVVEKQSIVNLKMIDFHEIKQIYQ